MYFLGLVREIDLSKTASCNIFESTGYNIFQYFSVYKFLLKWISSFQHEATNDGVGNR